MLSLTHEYALRAVVYLAQHEPTGAVPGHRIAEALNIPPKYLSVILRSLVRAGVLGASPGKSGGFQLVRDPKDVRLFEVLAPFEVAGTGRAGCPFGNAVCSDEAPCSGHNRWRRVKREFDRFLMDTSVDDVSSQQNHRNVGTSRRRKRA